MEYFFVICEVVSFMGVVVLIIVCSDMEFFYYVIDLFFDVRFVGRLWVLWVMFDS